jgi:hypothetical protein
MSYDPQTVYAKYLKEKAKKEHKEGCGDDKCGCCPPGLVEVVDNQGNVVSCLTPNDAEQFYKNIYKCDAGFVKVFDLSGDFIGCLSVNDYATYKNT